MKVIGIIFVLGWIWLAYEVYNSPTMPDDYDNEDKL
tara:strand:+ start:330 stop:437 length:108 start_codon:yes stop_codon:yes gene_type:complete